MSEFVYTRMMVVRAVALKQGITVDDTKIMFDAIFDEIKDMLSKGGIVKIKRFGTFRTIYHKSRLGCNVFTKKMMKTKPTIRPSLRPSQNWVDELTNRCYGKDNAGDKDLAE